MGTATGAKSASGTQRAAADGGFPAVVFHRLRDRLGLDSLTRQASADLLLSLDAHGAEHPASDLLARFLGDRYTDDDLWLFLYARNLVEDEFAVKVSLAAHATLFPAFSPPAPP